MITLNQFPTHIEYTENVRAPNKFVKVNNQNIYNGKIGRFSRNIAVRNLHKYVKSSLVNVNKISKYPVVIHYDFYTVRNHGSISMRKGNIIWKPPSLSYVPNWDIDNLAFLWIKVINDTLQEEGILKNDNVNFVEGGFYRINYVDDIKDRKIIIKFIS